MGFGRGGEHMALFPTKRVPTKRGGEHMALGGSAAIALTACFWCVGVPTIFIGVIRLNRLQTLYLFLLYFFQNNHGPRKGW